MFQRIWLMEACRNRYVTICQMANVCTDLRGNKREIFEELVERAPGR